jgi:small conductance mechanosensitive channel
VVVSLVLTAFRVFAVAYAVIVAMLVLETYSLGEFALRSTGAVVVVVVALLLVRLIKPVQNWLKPQLLRRATERSGDTEMHYRAGINALSLIGTTVRWALLAIAFLYVLAAFGVNLWPVLTGLGFLGAAIAFGSQALVRDLVSGLFIMLEGQYAVGEYVSLSGHFGRVVEIGFRTTVLETPEGKRLYLPNGTIGSVQVFPQGQADHEARLPLAHTEEAERLREPVEALARELQLSFPRRILEVRPPRIYGQGDRICGLLLRFTVAPGQHWLLAEELVPRLNALLAAEEVALPAGMSVSIHATGPGSS